MQSRNNELKTQFLYLVIGIQLRTEMVLLVIMKANDNVCTVIARCNADSMRVAAQKIAKILVIFLDANYHISLP